MRPRCREFLPLATQQLRLRNLVRIHGQNIETGPDDQADALIYYTLHSNNYDAPFYTSEALPLRHTQQKWAEIHCPQIAKSNANCVCVKVWKRLDAADKAAINEQETENNIKLKQAKQLDTQREPISALTKELSNVCLSPQDLLRPPDKLLFTWGVYFSGLILLGQYTDAMCCTNSLIFQINGDYFASPEYFTEDSLRAQLSLSYQRYSASVPRYIIPQTCHDSLINSPKESRSADPTAVGWQQDLLRMSKKRYAQWYCAVEDVRRSYDIDKLLRMQKLQRKHLKIQQESDEYAQEIKRLSLHCITQEQLLWKPRTKSLSSSLSHHNSYHSMGRTLTVLLAEQEEVDPHTLFRAQQILQKIETVRCRHRLLQAEHSTYTQRIERLRQRLTSIAESRLQLVASLAQRHTQLHADKEELAVRLQEVLHLQQTKRQIMHNVERRMSALCGELREIYPIGRSPTGFYTVCNILFPKMDARVHDTNYASNFNLENVSPMALSASLGYIAHLVQMMAVIINRPLRNPIQHEGSKTRIMDVIRELPFGSREFPLYTRSAIPSKPVKYAILLLNQNISQLCYDITGQRCDTRATIENLLHIFTILGEIEQNTRETHTNSHTHPNNRLRLLSRPSASAPRDDHDHEHDSTDCLSKSHSSVDMQHDVLLLQPPVPSAGTMTATQAHLKSAAFLQMPPIGSQPMAIGGRTLVTTARVCRSVGSYSDSEDDLKEIIEHCYSNSDSNIQFRSDHH